MSTNPDYKKYPCCGYEHRWLPGAGKWVSTGRPSCVAASLDELEQRRLPRAQTAAATAAATAAHVAKRDAQPTDNRLKLARRAANMTVLQLAVAAQVHVNTINALERDLSGGCNAKTAEALAAALGISPAWLVGWDPL